MFTQGGYTVDCPQKSIKANPHQIQHCGTLYISYCNASNVKLMFTLHLYDRDYGTSVVIETLQPVFNKAINWDPGHPSKLVLKEPYPDNISVSVGCSLVSKDHLPRCLAMCMFQIQIVSETYTYLIVCFFSWSLQCDLQYQFQSTLIIGIPGFFWICMSLQNLKFLYFGFISEIK